MRRDKKGESLGHRKPGKKNERLHMTLTNPSRRHPTWLKEEKVHRRQPESDLCCISRRTDRAGGPGLKSSSTARQISCCSHGGGGLFV